MKDTIYRGSSVDEPKAEKAEKAREDDWVKVVIYAKGGHPAGRRLRLNEVAHALVRVGLNYGEIVDEFAVPATGPTFWIVDKDKAAPRSEPPQHERVHPALDEQLRDMGVLGPTAPAGFAGVGGPARPWVPPTGTITLAVDDAVKLMRLVAGAKDGAALAEIIGIVMRAQYRG